MSPRPAPSGTSGRRGGRRGTARRAAGHSYPRVGSYALSTSVRRGGGQVGGLGPPAPRNGVHLPSLMRGRSTSQKVSLSEPCMTVPNEVWVAALHGSILECGAASLCEVAHASMRELQL